MSKTFAAMWLSIGLSVATLWAISALKSLPYGEGGDLTDTLSLPGAFIAFLFYPEGVHTGRGAASWGWTVLVGNWLFYALVWFILLQTLRLFRGRDQSPH